MLKKLSKKSVLLFAAALSLAAFVMPSVASAASWGVVGSTHDLTSSDLRFTNHDGSLGSSCALAALHANVASAGTLTVQSGAFTGCMGTGSVGVACTTTPVGTFPWQATGITTTNIQIHNVVVNVVYETTPGNATPCAIPGAVVTLTGTLASPNHTHWLAASHHLKLNDATGLVAHAPALGVAGQPVTINGTIRDTQQTLTLS